MLARRDQWSLQEVYTVQRKIVQSLLYSVQRVIAYTILWSHSFWVCYTRSFHNYTLHFSIVSLFGHFLNTFTFDINAGRASNIMR